MKYKFIIAILVSIVIVAHAQKSALTLGVPLGHTAPITWACFANNDKNVVSTSDGDKTLRIWETRTGRLIKTYTQSTKSLATSISRSKVSPDGKFLAVPFDSVLIILNFETGQEQVIAFEKEVIKCEFSSASNRLAVCLLLNTVWVYELAVLKPVAVLKPKFEGALQQMVFNNSATVLAMYEDFRAHQVVLFNIAKQKEIKKFKSQRGKITFVRFLDNDDVFIQGDGGELVLMRQPNYKVIYSINSYSPGDKFWNIMEDETTLTMYAYVEAHLTYGGIYDSLPTDEKYIPFPKRFGTNSLLQNKNSFNKADRSLLIIVNDKMGENKGVLKYNYITKDTALLMPFITHKFFATGCIYSPQHKYIAAASSRALTIISQKNAEIVGRIEFKYSGAGYQFSHNEDLVLVADHESLYSWSVRDNRIVTTYTSRVPHYDRIYKMGASNNFLIGKDYNKLKVLDFSGARIKKEIVSEGAHSFMVKWGFLGSANAIYAICQQLNTVDRVTTRNSLNLWKVDEVDPFKTVDLYKTTTSGYHEVKVSPHAEYLIADNPREFPVGTDIGKGYTEIYDINKNDPVFFVPYSKRLTSLQSYSFSDSDRLVTIRSLGNMPVVFDIQHNKVLFNDSLAFKNEHSVLSGFWGSQQLIDDRYFLLSHTYNTHVYDLKKQLWADTLTGLLNTNVSVSLAAICPNNVSHHRKVLLTLNNSKIYLWNTENFDSIASISIPGKYFKQAYFNNNDQYIIAISADFTISIFDANTLKLVFTSGPLTLPLSSVELSADNKYLYAITDGQIKMYDIHSQKEAMSYFNIDTAAGLFVSPEGYYKSERSTVKSLYYIRGLQTLGFDQLDTKYNRPDIVLGKLGAALGNADSILITSYYNAWQKRIKKLNIDTSSFKEGFSVPEGDFTNRSEIAYAQSSAQLQLKIWGSDSTYELDRYNLWVNNVPIFGQKGINIRQDSLNVLNATVSVVLDSGLNKIETSVMNVNGIESYKIPLYVEYTPEQNVVEQLHFIGIGIDEYQQTGHNLRYCVKDIRDLASNLKNRYGDNIIIDTLLNSQATALNIHKLKPQLLKSDVNDKVIIAFSGHGLLSRSYDYYLSTHNVDFKNPVEAGLPYEELEWLLDSIPARKKLLLIDACHSGEVDKEELEAINAFIDSTGRGMKLAYSYKPILGMKNSFELMQELFTNVNRGTGATVIAAAGGTQFAQERGNLKNGVFTYSILELMQQRDTIKVSELKDAVYQRVEMLSDGLQKPTSRNENIENDWEVW